MTARKFTFTVGQHDLTEVSKRLDRLAVMVLGYSRDEEGNGTFTVHVYSDTMCDELADNPAYILTLLTL